jgi:hypothetical protein
MHTFFLRKRKKREWINCQRSTQGWEQTSTTASTSTSGIGEIDLDASAVQILLI